MWHRDFCEKLPSYKDNKLTFIYVMNKEGKEKYSDGFRKNNKYIKEVLPKVYFIDNERNIKEYQDDLLRLQDNMELADVREDICMFDKSKKCNRCFECIGIIEKKQPHELSVHETSKLLEYKLYNQNLNRFAEQVNKYLPRMEYIPSILNIRQPVISKASSRLIHCLAIRTGVQRIILIQ